MKTIIPPRTIWIALWLVAVLCCVTTVAHAVDYVWQGTATNPRWHLAGNWLGGSVPPGNGTDDIVFGNPAATQFSPRYNLAAPATNFNSFTFTNGGWSLGLFTAAPVIRLGPGSITVSADVASGVTFGMPSFIDGPRTITNNSTSGAVLTFQADAGGAGNPSYTWIINNQGNLLTFSGPGSFVFGLTGGAIRGAGGLTKNGSGSITLNDTNTFTGPITHNAGTMIIGTVHAGGNAVTVADGATFGATVSAAGSTLTLSILSLGGSATGNVTNQFNFGTLGNPTAPVVWATNLTATATNLVNVAGSGLGVGQVTLYQSTIPIVGTNNFLLGALPVGRQGQLLFTANSVILDITNAPNLFFTGNTNSVPVGIWDINGTSNWVDGGLPVFYQNGLSVNFDDTSFTNVVTLKTNVSPFNIVVNTTAGYTITNDGTTRTISGTGANLAKRGSGPLKWGVAGTYGGRTVVEAGTLQLTVSNAIGDGSDVTLSNSTALLLAGLDETIGALGGSGVISNSATTGITNRLTFGGAATTVFSGQILDGASPLAVTKQGAGPTTLSGNNTYSGGTAIGNGGGLILGGNNLLGSGVVELIGAGNLSADATPRTLTNSLVMNNSRVFLGRVGASLTTLSGNVSFGGNEVRLLVESDVVLSGATIGNGMIRSKEEAGTLTLRNIAGALAFASRSTEIQHGALVLDGARITNSVGGLYVMQSSSNVSYLIITNGGMWVSSGAGNLRIGSAGANTSTNGTNIADISGSLLLSSGSIQLGRDSKRDTLIVRSGGVIQASGISHSDPNGVLPTTELNLNGGTLRANANNTTAFIAGLSTAVIGGGGVTVDSAGFNIGIAQALGGTGGLTKTGAGALYLDGANTYTGTTLVTAGSLVGGGSIAGPVSVTAGGTLAPGTSIGTLTINNGLTLAGDLQIEVNKDASPSNDVVAVTGMVNYGGTLTVVTNGITPFVVGDTFQIVTAGSQNGDITVVGSPGDGLAWNFDETTGVLTVASSGVVQPTLQYTNSFGTNLTFTWTGNFKLQAQTNTLAVGISTNWGDYPDGGTSPVNVPINVANGSVFFRLASP